MEYLLKWCIAEIKALKGRLNALSASLGQLRTQVQGISGGGATPQQVIESVVFDSISDLRADTELYNQKIAFVYGGLIELDGGGGIYRYNTASIAADNDLSVIQPTAVSGAGRYEKWI